MEEKLRQIIALIDDRPEIMAQTPKRAAAMLEELTSGYRQDPKELIEGAVFESDSKDPVLVKDIPVYSLCEHHLLPFFGRCHVGYLPSGKLIGLSRIGAIVDFFAKRLQLQERLTHQIADFLAQLLEPRGLIVQLEMRHLCMEMRGLKKSGQMVTVSRRGLLDTDAAARAEWMGLISG